jgi:hypothetical protein
MQELDHMRAPGHHNDAMPLMRAGRTQAERRPPDRSNLPAGFSQNGSEVDLTCLIGHFQRRILAASFEGPGWMAGLNYLCSRDRSVNAV